jgi:hypothetical protein
MTSFTRMHWTGVEPISIPSPILAAQAAVGTSAPSCLDFEALRRERIHARRIANLKWACVGSGVSWLGFILLSL